MAAEKINSWKFREELVRLAKKSTKNKEATAARNANALYYKYQSLISSDIEEKEYYKKKFNKYESMFNVLKSGRINYSIGENITGTILLSQIEAIEIDESKEKNRVRIVMKNGKEIFMGSDFCFLKQVL